MLKFVTAVMLAAVLPASLAAQDADRASTLRQEIAERFSQRVQAELQLSNTQRTQLRSTVERFSRERVELVRAQTRLRQELAQQLRPAATPDGAAMGRLADQLIDARAKEVDLLKREMAELRTYLDPVQATKFFVMQERLRQQVERVRQQRR